MKKGKAPLPTKLAWFEKTYTVLLLVIFGGMVLHAPLTVALGTLFPHYDLLIKSWKELLMGVAGVLLLVILWRRGKLAMLREPLVLLIGAFAAVHLLVIPLLWQHTQPTLAGILIDLRYLFYFVLVYAAVRLYPALRRPFLLVGLIGALVITVFAVLQVTVLPNDILKYLGYSKDTIAPYLTVDQNMTFIRVNSTLRGPNPLGAYAGMVLALLAAYLVRGQLQKANRPQVIAGVLGAASLVSVWVSYSRSALLGAAIGVGAVMATAYAHKVPKKVWIALAIVAVLLAGSLFALRKTDFVSNVIFHQNLHGGSTVDSNQGHVSSLQDAVTADLTHPLGVGIGSTGSASLLGATPDDVENQYLFDAHEAGLVSLALFLVIYVIILQKLWQRRADWLALGMFASGLGLAVIGLLLPVWADDTVSIIWFGLAAVAVVNTPRDGPVLQSKYHATNRTKSTSSARATKPAARSSRPGGHK